MKESEISTSLSQVMSPLWQHCSDMTDCYNCTTAISGCHWCADQTCSAYGTTHCVFGETCASPSDCIRSEPEFSGYQPPPAKAVVLFVFISFVIMSAFIFCLWCCFTVWDKRRMKALKHRVDARRRNETELKARLNREYHESARSSKSVQLSAMPVSTYFRSDAVAQGSSSIQLPKITVTTVTTKKKRDSTNPELAQGLLNETNETSDGPLEHEIAAPQYNVHLNNDGTAAVSPADNLSPTANFIVDAQSEGKSLPFPPPLPPLPRKQQLIRSCAKLATVMACLGTLIALIVLCLLYPHMPQYSICNKDIKWTSILTNLVYNFQLSVNVDLHMSVYNPNRFHMQLNTITARLLYNSDIVGTGAMQNISFPSGSIDDFLISVAFAPSLTSATSMLRDHLKGQLLIDVLFDLDTSILVGQFARPVIALNTTYVYENIDAEGEAEREFCKCKDPNVNAVMPTSKFATLSTDSTWPHEARRSVFRTNPLNIVARIHNAMHSAWQSLSNEESATADAPHSLAGSAANETTD